ncbi:L-rhamnose mutarotase [Catalinimonas alkaloidigena]|uniref:L-rhamnose mutarotase n=1 Tax=Catalinimonas alkaloidigena TaxID=1075417 RepID=A0A1G9N7J3_9BACT|nr:L-rhamnose mutarotase [Catalinimonas alkaloidigena]SDL82512.1 L-rhamnose mutarotase [Catalinimonas alkaloidigena]
MTSTVRHCLALDLQDDPAQIAEYERYHQRIWPEIADSIRESGILHMEIYRVADRLFMIMETTPDFSFEKKAALDASNPKVQEWENLMWRFQKSLPHAQPGEKWLKMEKIFDMQTNA